MGLGRDGWGELIYWFSRFYIGGKFLSRSEFQKEVMVDGMDRKGILGGFAQAICRYTY